VFAAHGRKRRRKLAFAAAFTAAVPLTAGAQQDAPRDFDPIQIPSGGRPLTIVQLSDIPRQLNTVINRSQCRVVEDQIKEMPVLIFRPADGFRVMALVPCQAIVAYSRAFLFERSIETEPILMTFPVLAPTGFSASVSPGLMSWDADMRMLTAWRGTDYCPSTEVRHVYRHGVGELNGFALVKVEAREQRCTRPEAEWKIVWQATPWNLPR
jgi:hypothetical protein